MKCPICHQEMSWQNNPFRPFCSERCKMADLGNWADGQYRIGGGPRNEADAEYSANNTDSADPTSSDKLN